MMKIGIKGQAGFSWVIFEFVLLIGSAGVLAACSADSPSPAVTGAETIGLAESLTFHASFDASLEADFALSDPALYTGAGYTPIEEAIPATEVVGVEIAPQAGRFRSALRFTQKNTQRLFYKGLQNVRYSEEDWNGTVSLWLSLDPAVDLEPGFCDPIVLTDERYNDAAIWVDFSDKNPRTFNLGVFGDLSVWNPEDKPPFENPDFINRLVTVTDPPFAAGQWTHVAVTFCGLNRPQGGEARLYLNGHLQGRTEPIAEPFSWNPERATIRLAQNYAGLIDDLALFDRCLSDEEIQQLFELPAGAGSLHSVSQ